MSSRYPTSFHMDFCYSPVRISKNGRTFYVPCGKCNGCRLQKSNSLSQRLGDDIESSSHAIFTTLTYDNIHVPKMKCRKEGNEYHYFSASGNLRFNGRCDVPREPIDDLCVKLQAIRSQKDFVSEVDDICKNADKSKKVNSLVGLSPHIV